MKSRKVGIASAGFYRIGLDYKDHFSLDANGRKYQKHVMLIGVSKGYDYNSVKQNIQTWLYPRKITLLSDGFKFLSIDRTYRCINLRSIGMSTLCKFRLEPDKTVVNPCFTIENWKGSMKVEVFVDASKVDCRLAKQRNKLLIWIKTTINKPGEITISASAL